MKTRQDSRRFIRWQGASRHPSAIVKLRVSVPSEFRLALFFVVATIATDGSDDRRVSLFDELIDSDFVKISRSPDFDHFRSIDGLGEANSIPLDCRNFAASFASLRLKTCTIYLQRTFPRILQMQHSTTGAIGGLMMDDAASLILNGITEECEQTGYALFVEELPRFDTPTIVPVIEALMAHQVEGIIFAAPELNENVKIVQSQLPASRPPIIFLKCQPNPNYITIGIDNYGGARKAVYVRGKQSLYCFEDAE